ncbi:glycosyl transferase [Luteitalea sp. TBR-22]|uniref:glycosyltransferase n=1 Tax=Luteitalea sp. TBR-22 TaxID=2802971 RepID=UPI001AFC2375|nr:glycosyltransferase [Luteitalea sp. TBR-22]BCS30953.1 glycosyl transferase [Luteitalea sp. TBR-22]
MRALLTTIGSRGDVQPLVALGVQLRRRGHQVRVCAPPDFGDWIAAHELAFTPVGPSVRAFAAARPMGAPPAPPAPEQVRQMAAGTVGTQFDALLPVAVDCDVIVAASALQVAARSVAEHVGVPYVFATYSATVLPSPHHPPPAVPGRRAAPGDVAAAWAEDAERMTTLFGQALDERRAGLGLPAVGDVRAHMFTDRPWLAADPVLGPWPGEAREVRQTGAWMLEDTQPLAPELVAFLDAGASPVYIGFGSTRAGGDAAGAIRALTASLGVRVVVSRGWFDDALADATTSCLPIGDVNVMALFRRVAAVVHHGGAGTTTAAARAGVPQVVVPHQYDQHYWAGRVAALGIGVAHPAGPPSATSLQDAVERALAPDVVGRAGALAPTIRLDGVEVAVEALERLVAGP